MDTKQLLTWVEQPDTHRKIVGDYQGGYSLGVTDDPPAFVLRVEAGDTSAFPQKVSLHGVDVPVVVHGNYRPPVPLQGRP